MDQPTSTKGPEHEADHREAALAGANNGAAHAIAARIVGAVPQKKAQGTFIDAAGVKHPLYSCDAHGEGWNCQSLTRRPSGLCKVHEKQMHRFRAKLHRKGKRKV